MQAFDIWGKLMKHVKYFSGCECIKGTIICIFPTVITKHTLAACCRVVCIQKYTLLHVMEPGVRNCLHYSHVLLCFFHQLSSGCCDAISGIRKYNIFTGRQQLDRRHQAIFEPCGTHKSSFKLIPRWCVKVQPVTQIQCGIDLGILIVSNFFDYKIYVG